MRRFALPLSPVSDSSLRCASFRMTWPDGGGHPLRSLRSASPYPLLTEGELEWRYYSGHVAVVGLGWVVGDLGGTTGVGYVGCDWF